MSTQRRSTGRRGFLAALGGATGLSAAVGVSGCVASGGEERSDTGPVSVLAAGSLQAAMRGLDEAVEPTVESEAHGSVTVARQVASGRRDPDIVALADTALFDGPMDAPWHAAVATNALVVAYDGDTEAGRRVAAADRWFDPVLTGDVSLGRTDPDLDPLGYRTVFSLALAGEHYDEPDLRERLLDREQVYPETSLLGRFETGAVDAAVVYRSMAVDRGYDYRELPTAVDLSDPDRADRYATATYEFDDGETVRGAPIEYGAVARTDREPVRQVFETLASGGVLADHGFSVPDSLPHYAGEVPDGFGD